MYSVNGRMADCTSLAIPVLRNEVCFSLEDICFYDHVLKMYFKFFSSVLVHEPMPKLLSIQLCYSNCTFERLHTRHAEPKPCQLKVIGAWFL